LPGHDKVDATVPNFSKVEAKGITLLFDRALKIKNQLTVRSL
jgi:hypothetical protein